MSVYSTTSDLSMEFERKCVRQGHKFTECTERRLTMPKTYSYADKLSYMRTHYNGSNEGDGCWFFTGGIMKNGYGITPWGQTAHSAMYELFIGSLLDGYEVAHTGCNVRSCVRIEHLEQLTISEHRKRDGNQYTGITHCKRGHPFDEKNTGINSASGKRYCKECQ